MGEEASHPSMKSHAAPTIEVKSNFTFQAKIKKLKSKSFLLSAVLGRPAAFNEQK